MRYLQYMLAVGILLVSCHSKKDRSSSGKRSIDSAALFREAGKAELDSLNQAYNSLNLKTTDAIMEHYLPKDNQAEGNYSYQLSARVISAAETEVTLVTEGLMDDSVRGRKVIMVAQNRDGILQITALKESYRCYPDRGHEEWGAAPCA